MAKSRRAIAEELLDLHIEHADVFAKIDTLKEKLRELSIADSAGFKEKVDGKGEVSVSAPSVAKLKGIMPALKPEVFLELGQARRDKLVADGLVEMREEWTKERAPSVTVRLP
jgi:hypothetical protein